MKGRLLQNLSINTAQLIVNQLLGLGIFYFLSTRLDKGSFGRINLALAILLAVFNILSCGIDQLVVKKIAAGGDVRSILSLYIFHVLLAGGVFYGLLYLGYVMLPGTAAIYYLLMFIGIGKLMIFFSAPFKQAANGMERFKMMAWMLIVSNIVRCGGLAVLAYIHWFSLHNVVIVFVSGDAAELICAIALFAFSTKIPITIGRDLRRYGQLLREALPQTGVVLITSALARFDWIFIGVLVSAIKLAEYSFAYKVFEISSLPLLALAPLLVPRFTKIFQRGDAPGDGFKLLVRMEMIIAAFTILVLNICWSPVIDAVTSGKYGMVNVKTIFILSLCLPLLYLNNFFWTIYFAQGKLKMILRSFILTLAINVIGDVALIPFFGNEGAAFAYLAACLAQCIFYYTQNDLPELKNCWQSMVMSVLCAVLSGLVSQLVFRDNWLIVASSAALYVLTLVVTRQIRRADQAELRKLFN